jgi:hypothetical protein
VRAGSLKTEPSRGRERSLGAPWLEARLRRGDRAEEAGLRKSCGKGEDGLQGSSAQGRCARLRKMKAARSLLLERMSTGINGEIFVPRTSAEENQHRAATSAKKKSTQG